MVTIEDLEFIRETHLAIVVRTDDGEDITLPKREIDYDESAENGDVIDVDMPQWLAEDRGLV